MPVLLWTDGAFLLVLLITAGFLAYARRSEHFIRPWRSATSSHSARISLVILLVFLMVGLADSLHFQSKSQGQQGELTSLLDIWLESPRTHTEKTYSAPLAAYAYVREAVVDDQGIWHWTYPRLQYGGRHLQNPERELGPDLLQKAAWGVLKAGGVIGPILLISTLMRRKHWFPGPAVLTFMLLCVLTAVVREWADQYHVLGTDKVGEDVLYQSLKSIRTGLMMGVLTTLATVPLALGLGIMAGYFRGWVDDLIQYLYTTLNAIPGVLLIGASMLIMQAYMARHEAQFASLSVRADFRLMALCLILGLTSWTGLCRLLRAETLKVREMDYVLAARALGSSTSRILFKHILPNVFHLVLISLVLDFSTLVLAEAVLSYVNIGVDPTTYSWGNMINSARLEMAREPIVWWLLAAAFLFMFTLVLSANLFADAIREAFDPRRN